MSARKLFRVGDAIMAVGEQRKNWNVKSVWGVVTHVYGDKCTMVYESGSRHENLSRNTEAWTDVGWTIILAQRSSKGNS